MFKKTNKEKGGGAPFYFKPFTLSLGGEGRIREAIPIFSPLHPSRGKDFSVHLIFE